MKKIFLFAFLGLYSFSSYSQECDLLPANSAEQLMMDVEFLSNDRLEGRLPGTTGAEVAAEYISRTFMESELIPMGSTGNYYQPFEIDDWVALDEEKNSFLLNDESQPLNEVYFPLPYSSNGTATGKAVYVGFGISAPELEYDDYEKLSAKKLDGNIFIIDVSSPDGIHPHSAYLAYHSLQTRAELAKEKGASAVIFVNQGEMASDPNMKFRNIKSIGIPVVFLKTPPLKGNWKKYKKVDINVNMAETTVMAFNVIGYKDNNAPNTIVIGAHYDHLGWGADNSLYRGEPAIHNGADDNASGTAGLMELARYFAKDTMIKDNNILFIAFSGEERGLLGSSYFVKNSTIELAAINYMINMDMIGRMEKNELAISGVGTSPDWAQAIEKGNCKFDLTLSESGVGPSDHTSFYNQNIPVLHFFTGTHEDYHKPSDDFEKLNYKDEVGLLNMVINVMYELEGRKLEFTPTKNNDSKKAPKFSVTLGIVPDYMYDEGGVKLDGVTEGKPASNGGLKAGDIVTKMGTVQINDMYSYMDALAMFKVGDTIIVEYLREGKKQSTEITF